jgi:hypothetical protein
MSWRVWLKAFDALTLSDEGDDGVDIVGGQAGDRWHVTEVPMMGAGAVSNREMEGTVGVMTRFIDDREVGWPLVGPA